MILGRFTNGNAHTVADVRKFVEDVGYHRYKIWTYPSQIASFVELERSITFVKAFDFKGQE